MMKTLSQQKTRRCYFEFPVGYSSSNGVINTLKKMLISQGWEVVDYELISDDNRVIVKFECEK